jgi:hypothetical protein
MSVMGVTSVVTGATGFVALLVRVFWMPAQSDVESEHGAVDVDAVVGILGRGKIVVRDVHPVQACRNGVARVEVIAGAGAHVHRESVVLSLGVIHAEGSFGVNDPQAGADIHVGHDPPLRVDKISPKAHVVGKIVGLGALRNRGDGSGKGDIPVAAENPGTAHVVDLPAKRGEDGDQRVSKRVEIVRIAFKDIERKRDIEGEPSYIERELELVSEVNVAVEVGGFRAREFFDRRLDLCIRAGTQRCRWVFYPYPKVGSGRVEGFGAEVDWRATEGTPAEIRARKRTADVLRGKRQTGGLVAALLGGGEWGEYDETRKQEERKQSNFAGFYGSRKCYERFRIRKRRQTRRPLPVRSQTGPTFNGYKLAGILSWAD